MTLDERARPHQAGPVIAGRYRLVGPIGRGGMGAVWRAVDETLGREVAVKELLVPHGITAEDRAALRERSLREARIAARLRHPALVTVHDVVIEQDTPHIVMEFVPSRSLQDTIAADGALPPVRVAEIGLAVLDGLRAAHEAGVLHRDVKPSNVLIGTDGRVMLADFGVARFEGDSRLTLTGQVMGSPGYIAPEFGQGAAAASPASDLWSLGATLYTAVEGRPPYDRDSFFAVLAAAATEDPAPMLLAGPLAPVIGGLLRRDPADRLDTGQARRILGDVARGQAGATVPYRTQQRARRPDGTGPGRREEPRDRPDGPRRRRRIGLGLAAGAVLLLAGTAAGMVAAGPPLLGATDSDSAESEGPARSARPDGGPTRGPAGPEAGTGTGLGDGTVPPGTVPYLDRDHSFSMRVPRGWVRRAEENFVLFTRPGGGLAPDLLVARNPAFPGGSLGNLQAIDRNLALKKAANSYRRLRLESVPAPAGADWADLEFTMVRSADDGVRWRIVDRNITTDGGVSYAVRFRFTETEWPQSEALVRAALDSFRSLPRR